MPVASTASVTMMPSTCAAPRADRLQEPELAAPLGDDGGEQHAHHQRGAGEHQHHQGEDAVEQRRQALADARQRGVAGHDLDALHVRQDGEARLQRRGAGRQLGQEAAHLAGRQHGGLGAVAAAHTHALASASSVANDMNTPRSWVPTPVRPSRP